MPTARQVHRYASRTAQFCRRSTADLHRERADRQQRRPEVQARMGLSMKVTRPDSRKVEGNVQHAEDDETQHGHAGHGEHHAVPQVPRHRGLDVPARRSRSRG
jgi:hypothetical protein